MKKEQQICEIFKDLDLKALVPSRWQKLKARLFGYRCETTDSGWKCVSYFYKDVMYVFSLKQVS